MKEGGDDEKKMTTLPPLLIALAEEYADSNYPRRLCVSSRIQKNPIPLQGPTAINHDSILRFAKSERVLIWFCCALDSRHQLAEQQRFRRLLRR